MGRGVRPGRDLRAGRGVLDGRGVGVDEASFLGGPEGLGGVGAVVVIDERCDGAVGGAFADLLFGGRPQDGRVVGGVGGDGRCGRQPGMVAAESRGAEGLMGLVPMSVTPSSVWG